ncbi:MAG: site-specific integrase [Terriglobia bacterium]
MNSVQDGLPLAPDRQTVAQYLSYWLEHVAAKQVRPKTHRTYKDLAAQHLIPALGKIALSKLTPQRIREFMNAKLAEKTGRDERTYSARSVKHMPDTLRAALNIAVRDGVLPRNPAALVDSPRASKEHEPCILGPEEARQFLEACHGSRLEALFCVTLALGMREGEILGLRWADIDFESRTLTIRYQLQRLDGKLKLAEPKTQKSRRSIVVPAIAVAALRAHQMRQQREQILAGERWHETGMVFTTSIGTMLDARNMLREFYRIIRDPRNSLPQIRFTICVTARPHFS